MQRSRKIPGEKTVFHLVHVQGAQVFLFPDCNVNVQFYLIFTRGDIKEVDILTYHNHKANSKYIYFLLHYTIYFFYS